MRPARAKVVSDAKIESSTGAWISVYGFAIVEGEMPMRFHERVLYPAAVAACTYE